MGKIGKSVRRVDGETEDHVHLLPNGEMTSGALYKPRKDQFGMHSHLYEHNEDTFETEPTHIGGDHAHPIEWHKEAGVQTSGPRPVPKKPGEPWEKMDSMQREGSSWVVRSTSGRVLKRSENRSECESFLKEQNAK